MLVCSPHSADTTCGQSPGSNGGPLLHEASNWEPETVAKRVLVDQQVPSAFYTRVGIVPLIRCQPVEDDRKNQTRNKATKSRVKVGFSILTMLFKLMLSDKSLSISFYSRVFKPVPRATILHWLRKIYLGKDWFSRTEWDQP